MGLNVVILNDDARERVAKVLEFASKPENFYLPHGGSPKPPGDIPAHVVQLGDFRCVFSLTKVAQEKLFRHLSVSVPSNERAPRLPNPMMVAEVARLFGFQGPEQSWHIGPHMYDGCIVVIQEVEP